MEKMSPLITRVEIIIMSRHMRDIPLKVGTLIKVVHNLNHTHSQRCLRVILPYMLSGVRNSIVFSFILMQVRKRQIRRLIGDLRRWS